MRRPGDYRLRVGNLDGETGIATVRINEIDDATRGCRCLPSKAGSGIPGDHKDQCVVEELPAHVTRVVSMRVAGRTGSDS